ncbi:MAG: tRNA (adenosine(37)-N6)-threonylcarbamoyltransferase complex ATPase subunit type 1 TsaE [Thiothrix sp.]|nr:tRNA (adenosine(37)-N6)-threonylcarbamoyltransferase complex ATPase subunit type 1 TsaE [Thiothrix sp.]HPQ97850.1 tRNA (adenosine(37)-N6)-threonylcarbamoyltransferase complex ATPase subunit type 1 TsaE [Thiolinea sp.]
MEREYQIKNEQAMLNFGAALLNKVKHGGLVTLHGELGSGKTTLVRGLLQALGHQGRVKSPTYTLVEPYRFGRLAVYHFDLYRLHDPEELDAMGFRDYLHADSLCLVEWPEKAGDYLPVPLVRLHLSYSGTGRRILEK